MSRRRSHVRSSVGLARSQESNMVAVRDDIRGNPTPDVGQSHVKLRWDSPLSDFTRLFDSNCVLQANHSTSPTFALCSTHQDPNRLPSTSGWPRTARGCPINSTAPRVAALTACQTRSPSSEVKMSRAHFVPANTVISHHSSSETSPSRRSRAAPAPTISSTALSSSNGSLPLTSELSWIASTHSVTSCSATSRYSVRTSMPSPILQLVLAASATVTLTSALIAPDSTENDERFASASTTPMVPIAKSVCHSTMTPLGDVPHPKTLMSASHVIATATRTNATSTETSTIWPVTEVTAWIVRPTEMDPIANAAKRTFTCVKTDIARIVTATRLDRDRCNVTLKESVSASPELAVRSVIVARPIIITSDLMDASLVTATLTDLTTTRLLVTLKLDSALARKTWRDDGAASANPDSSTLTLTTSSVARLASASVTPRSAKAPPVTQSSRRSRTSTRTRRNGVPSIHVESSLNRSTTRQGRASRSPTVPARTFSSAHLNASWVTRELLITGFWSSSCSSPTNVDQIHHKATSYSRVPAPRFHCQFLPKAKECPTKVHKSSNSVFTSIRITPGSRVNRLVSSCPSWAIWRQSRSAPATPTAVKLFSTTLNCKLPIAVQPETPPSGLNSVSAPKDTSANSANLALPVTVTAQRTAAHSCLASLATATNTPRSVILKLVGASASTTLPETIAISAHEATTETLWEDRLTTVWGVLALTTVPVCSFLTIRSSAWNAPSGTLVRKLLQGVKHF